MKKFMFIFKYYITFQSLYKSFVSYSVCVNLKLIYEYNIN